jgi:putative intracellular protease/amidase
MNGIELVHLAVYDTMADWEPGYAISRINNPLWQRSPDRFRVQTVAETREPITTMGGMRIVPDITLAELGPGSSAMLVLPGGLVWDTGGNGVFAEQAARFLRAGTPVAAICGATLGLARAGLLDEYDHTSSAAMYLEQASGYHGGGRYREEPAVTDRGLITAGGTDPIDFAQHIFAKLGLYTSDVLDAWYRLYHDSDASAFAVLAAA